MNQDWIDYRSDTVTRPSTAMLEYMLHAKVGDDVFGEDITTNELENRMATLFNKEAGLFCPSGTMSNQIAIKVHTQPGDEIICDTLSHIYQYEGGGIAFNSGCSVKLVNGDRGRITAEQVLTAINPTDIHKPNTSLVSLENTANRGGGSCYHLTDIQQIKEACIKNNLKLHLDGARIFNALIAQQQKPEQYGNEFDSISICLSKGLGTPAGSVLVGNKEFIYKARRIRKVFGGGMRQTGYLAAAGIYAIENNIERLQEDHHHAQQITHALLQKKFIGNIFPVETNIIIFELKDIYTAASFVAKMKEQGILMIAISPTQVRMVLHLDISEEMVQKTIRTIQSL